MHLSDPVLVYGDPTSSTHILVQKKDTEKHPLYYAPREVNGKIACYTRFPEDAKYFGIRSFAEEDFHEIIRNVHPSELVNIIFCNFGDKNPNEVSKNDIYDYISYEHQNFFGYFSTFLTELKDSFISQREVIDSILVKNKEKNEPKKSKTQPKSYDFKVTDHRDGEKKENYIIYKYDKTKMINFVEEKIDGNQIIITRGVLEKYELDEVHQYSDQLKPGERKTIKGEPGFKYTKKFDHPFGHGIAKDAIAPIIQTSIYEYFEPNTIYHQENNLNKYDLHYNEDELFEFMSDLPDYTLNYTKRKYLGDNGLYLKLENTQKSMKIKLDPNILNNYPDVKLGSIISKSEPSIIIVPTNEIVEYLEESTLVENLDLNLFPMSKTYISVQNLLAVNNGKMLRHRTCYWSAIQK